MDVDEITKQIIAWINEHRSEIVNETDSFKIFRLMAKDLNIKRSQFSGKLLFDTLFPEKIITCENARFSCFAVGYRTCSKSCDCYVKRVSEAVSSTKSLYTDEKRKAIQEKREQTNIDKYGYPNPFNFPEVKEKILENFSKMDEKDWEVRKQKTRNTCQQRYEVDNVMQLDENKKKNQENRDHASNVLKGKETKLSRYGFNFTNKEKAKATCLEKYGVDNPSKDPAVKQKISESARKYSYTHIGKFNVTPEFSEVEYKSGVYQQYTCNICGHSFLGRVVGGKFSRCLKCFPYSKSMEELEVKEFIQTLNISFISNSQQIIKPREIDIFIPSHNIGIEYCGMYYHREQKGKDQWYHWSKMLEMDALGYKLITLFSDQWYGKQDIVKSRIRTMLHLNEIVYYARKCKVFRISSAISSAFMEENHLQGSMNSRYNFGLFSDNNELLACMEISQSRFQKKQILELTRFAVKKNISVIGAAGKLFSFFVKQYSPTEIVSYSDNCWGLTNFYQKLGFVKKSNGSPGYTYIDLSNHMVRYNRMKFQKHKLPSLLSTFDPTLTEYENMVVNNYDKVWDCGHSVWQWTKQTNH